MGQAAGAAPDAAVERFDAIVIGAGISGLYLIQRLRALGFSVRAFEAGSGVGGTWYWNRYPGARFDSESWSYGYSFSDELLAEWDWSEHFAAQPETLRYLEHVADKFDLRSAIRFNARVAAARYREAANLREVVTDDGERAEARFLVTAVGVLSAPYVPDIAGRDSFAGRAWHTAEWPHEPLALDAARVGVIGSGATAVQLITELAKSVAHLTVFQRTPNYCLPLRNHPIDAETQTRIKASYPEIFARCRATFGAFVHDFDPRSALAVSAEERRAIYERLWREPGFALWLGNFHDIMTDREANATLTEFVRERIRERIDDPAVAAKLVPTDHPFGTRRVPLESGYYEAFNRPNVTLVDLREDPIERITPSGIRTRARDHRLDVIVFATGFDAVTGALTRIDLRGEGGVALKDKWADGPRTYLGMQTAGFPNLFIVVGPQNAASFCNVPRCIEQNVEWVTECMRYLRAHGLERIRATTAAEDAWTQHCAEIVAGTLIPETDSWFMGTNIPGKKRVFLMYAAGARAFRETCDRVAARGYEGFDLG
jgi:cation diffusion facilitator CzcD-associated flavoprotein CzcO